MDFALDLTNTWVGYLSLMIFFVSYYFVAREEAYHMNKAKPALLAGTSMFIVIGIYFVLNGLDTNLLHAETKHLIAEISEIFFFLLVAMTFIEVMVNRGVFEVLKRKLILHGYTYKKLFWILGFLAFFISPVADNLTTALILSTVAHSLSKNPKILVPMAVNIVVASNAGGSWSPFGDITTLMAWSAGKGEFQEFLFIFPAAFVGWLVTAGIISIFVGEGKPETTNKILNVNMKPGAKKVIYLGLFTIFISVIIHHYFNIPAMWGMMFGLSLLHLTSYHSKKFHKDIGFDIYKNIKKTEIDTLLFFFGILSAVGALDFLGYLSYIVKFYEVVGFTYGHIIIGFFSALVDNIPVMSAVLKSDLEMGTSGWLMLTLSVGIGGSLISFGSAAGVGVMSKMKGIYTFGSHMRFFPAILLGYLI
ncbi:MAG: sodium:proton antiporter, partial [Candidatus Gracilibacteria bacterium]|nr:sodium:proton antiporter [Candidatus Gracilibacteria bacterium]